ncbi:MAG: ATP-dependent DNA helicase [Elusimicrobia bacterium]|nr:ATP-dependent DNA helicase [Elusimicrobiota bacterium]
MTSAEELFSPEGPLGREQDGYESRPAQVRMAAAVQETLERGGALVVEAGTGVGKSLAYLLPGALWAASGDRRLQVSTHTRALQEQLLERELPTAARVLRRLGLSLRYALLMGADNYLCVRRLERLRAEPELPLDGGGLILEELSVWAKRADTGLRSHLPCLVPQPLWRRLCRDPEVCFEKGRQGAAQCGRCLYRCDRERAEKAHVLVVNHALFLSSPRLPPADALVVDEAHTLPEAAASHLGTAVGPGRFLRLAEAAAALARRAAQEGVADDGSLAEAERFAALCADEGPRFLRELALRHGSSERVAEPGGRLLEEPVESPEPESLPGLERCLAEVKRLCADPEDELEAQVLRLRAASLRRDLRSLLEERSLETARWVEWYPFQASRPRGRGLPPASFGVGLRSQPLDVSEALAEKLLGPGIPVVMTSATLSWGRGLREFKAQAGLPGARELVLDSPFDFREQAALLIVDDGAEPSDEARYAAAVARRCRELIPRVPGGVFILFSSWKMLRRVHGLIRRRVRGRPLWVQGASGNEALLEDFISAGNAVLLGVDTFWQGVDVPGAALSCVVLTKLPFPNFASPVEAARRRWHESFGRSYFESWSLPRAVMKLRQGFGRLIRTASDRGAVVILDSRILRKRYGEAFLEALPPCRRLADMEELSAFFARGVVSPRQKKMR